MQKVESIKIGLWPLSGNYGKDFSSEYVENYLAEAIDRGFLLFDNAESYGDERFQSLLKHSLHVSDKIKVDTKVRVMFCEQQWQNTLRQNLDAVSSKYGNKLRTVFLHNPDTSTENIICALDIINGHYLGTQIQTGVSLQKNRYRDIEKMPAQRFQIDVNPSYCDHVQNISQKICPTKIEARSLFASGLLISDTINLNRGDQRLRWASEGKIESGNKFLSEALNGKMSRSGLLEALIRFPLVWGISQVVLGTTNPGRFVGWKKSKNPITPLSLKAEHQLLTLLAKNVDCF